MLTRKSAPIARAKMLLCLPLAIISIVCFSKNSFAHKFEKNGNIVTYRGNTFELGPERIDTMQLEDPVNGEILTKYIKSSPQPEKMNGRKIYRGYDLPEPGPLGSPTNYKAGIDGNGIKIYLLSNLKAELATLPDGSYYVGVNNVVLDEKGKIVYYDNGGIEPSVTNNAKVPQATTDKILKKIGELLDDAPAHTPGIFNGQEVPFMVAQGRSHFEIKNGKVVAE